MSETVLVALITFSAGFVGSVIGAVATYTSSSLNVKAEQGRLIYSEKKLAYADYISAYLAVAEHLADVEVGLASIQSAKTVDVMHQFFSAYSKVKLLAPANVQEAILTTADAVSRSIEGQKFPDNSEGFDELAEAMREDLYSFSVETGKKRWFQPRK